jgi:hypothetical protein
MKRFLLWSLLLLAACGGGALEPTAEPRPYPAPPDTAVEAPYPAPLPLATAVPDAYPITPTNPTNTMMLTLAQPARLPDGTTVTLLSAEDSRCPTDVDCVWAGELVAQVRLQKEDGQSEEVRLTTLEATAVRLLDGQQILIASAEPAPLSTQSIALADYQLVLALEKGQPGVPNAGVYVDEVEVLLMESFPVQAAVLISGNLADGCTGLVRTEVARTGDQFVITLFTYRPADRMCTEALVPFTERVALDIAGLPAGKYEVVVGEQTTAFTLDVDN